MAVGTAVQLIVLLLRFSSVLSKIEFLAIPRNTAALLGQDTRLHCSAQDSVGNGTLLYNWEFMSGPLKGKMSIFGNNTLVIPRTEQSDLGEYTCKVTREDTQETVSRSAFVIELYTQDFLAHPKSVEASLGENAEFTCITGRIAPNPDAFWEKDGRVYSGGRQVNASYGDADPLGVGLQYSLSLSLPVDESAAGVYRCVVRNPLSQMTMKSEPAFLTITVPDTSPSIEIAPPAEVYAAEGQPFSVDCVISGTPPPQILWRRDGADVSDGNRVVVVANGTLTFRTIERGDAGVYLCQGRNVKGSVSTGYMSLQVPYLGLTFRQQPRDVYAVAGQTAHVFCTPPDSDPPASVTWYRENAPYQTRTGEFSTSIDRTSPGAWDLLFANVQQADEGDYFCVAFNPHTVPQSRTSRVAKLSVTGGALFVEPPVGQDLIKGELLQLKCVVEGNPVPVITWYKDGEPLRLSDRVSLVKSGQELLIGGITKPDEGTYRCNVVNGLNNISASAFVRVRVPPAIVSQIGQVTVNLGVRSEVTLPCVVDGDPDPDVTWYHDGEKITNSGRRQILDDQLHIQDVIAGDSGKYTCRATNTAGNKSVTGSIDVISPPRFTVTPVNQSVTLGEGVSLRCEVTGLPPPTISWTFNDSQPLPGRHIVSSDLTVVTIATMRWEDAGIYSCFANNSAAEAVASATLTVQTLPEVLNITGKTVLPRGDDLELICEVRGVPVPSVSWLFQGQKVMSSLNGRISFSTENTLIVKFTAESDSGNYSCVSQNSAGQDVGSLHVTVYGPPEPPVLESVDPVSTTSVNVSWSAVSQAPYADVTSFIIRYKESFAEDLRLYRDDIHPTLTSVELGGLQPAMQYVVVMAAKNEAGEGTLSSALAATTFESGPSEPRALQVADVGSRWVRLTWEVPVFPRGQIRLYQVTYSDTSAVSGEVQSVLVTSPIMPLQKFTLESLKPHSTYSIKVRAATDLENGAPVWGNYTEQIQVTTLFAAPSASPQNLTLSAIGPRSFTVAWEPVAPGDINGPIKNYALEYISTIPVSINQSASADASRNHVTITASVFPWRQYHVTVRAVNEAGSGPASDPLTFTTSPDAPSGTPREVKATALAGEAILVEWKPVAVAERNGPIRGYRVAFGVSTERLRSHINISSPDALSTVIRDVLPFTLYEVVVAAFTSEVDPGQGPYSQGVQVMTSQTVPGPVRKVTYTVSPDVISLTWLPPEVATGPLKQYTVRYQPEDKASDALRLVTPPGQTSAVIGNLTADTMYTVEIMAENGAGPGKVTLLSIKTAQLGVTTSSNATNEPQGPLGSSPPPENKPNKHLAAIVAGSLTGGLVAVFVVVVVVYWCLKRRCKTSEERYWI